MSSPTYEQPAEHRSQLRGQEPVDLPRRIREDLYLDGGLDGVIVVVREEVVDRDRR